MPSLRRWFVVVRVPVPTIVMHLHHTLRVEVERRELFGPAVDALLKSFLDDRVVAHRANKVNIYLDLIFALDNLVIHD